MSFQCQTCINALKSPQIDSGIAELVLEILVLEELLIAPENQSEYFRMGIQHHRKHLAQLYRKFTDIRMEFNQHNLAEFRAEIVAQQQRIKLYYNLTPLIALQMVQSGYDCDITDIRCIFRSC